MQTASRYKIASCLSWLNDWEVPGPGLASTGEEANNNNRRRENRK